MNFVAKVIKGFILNLRLTALDIRESSVLEYMENNKGKADLYGAQILLKKIRAEREILLSAHEGRA